MTDTAPPSKRLSKAERRQQLLDTALEIVRNEGSDALTLGALAERAGVSKPIAYEHFGTRSGLLIALYRQFDDLQLQALQQALARTPRQLADVARLLSRAYMSCYAQMGPELRAVSAALKGTQDMDDFQRELVDGYVKFYVDTLGPFTHFAKEELRLRCVALIGAGEAIAQDMLRERVSEARAATAMAATVMAVLGPAG